MTHLQVGDSIRGNRDTYLVERATGAGACGETYLATGTSGRRFVLEEVALDMIDEWATLDDCIRASGRLRRLRHPAVVPVIDTFAFDRAATPLSVIAVHANPGDETLAAAIADGHSFEAVELTEMFRSLLEGLRHVHALSPPVLHKNLGPESVILASDRAKLSGLGLVASGSGDPRDDLYQLASVIVFAATHRRLEDTASKHAAINLQKLAPNLEPPLRRALAAALDPRRDRRPASAAALLAILDEWSLSPRAMLRAIRSPRALSRVAIGAAALLLAGVGARAALSRAAIDEDDTGDADAEPENDTTQCPAKPDSPSPPEAGSEDHVYPHGKALPLLTWRATVLESRGIEVPRECLLELEAQVDDGEAADCTATLRCGSDALAHEVEPRVCQLAQSGLTEERVVYRLWFASDERSRQSIIVDGGRERLVWKRSGIDGEGDASITMKLGPSESAARSEIAGDILTSQPVQKGIVTSVHGDTAIPMGQQCTLGITSASHGRPTCRVEVRCGQRTLYEQWGVCDSEDGHTTEPFTDKAPSLIDGTPTFYASERRVVVEDVSVDGRSMVEITLPSAQ